MWLYILAALALAAVAYSYIQPKQGCSACPKQKSEASWES